MGALINAVIPESSIEDESKHYRKFDQIVCVSDGVRKAFLDKYEA